MGNRHIHREEGEQRHKEIFAAFRAYGPMSINELSKHIPVGSTVIRRYVNRLRHKCRPECLYIAEWYRPVRHDGRGAAQAAIYDIGLGPDAVRALPRSPEMMRRRHAQAANYREQRRVKKRLAELQRKKGFNPFASLIAQVKPRRTTKRIGS